MKHLTEILGTIGTIIFDIFVIGFIYFWWTNNAPLWVAITGTVAFGGVALYATYEVVKYWYKRIVLKYKGD